MICVGILASLVVIVLVVNVFAWDYYLPTDWTSNYRDTYDEFVYQRAIMSPNDSAAREYCGHITKCKIRLNKFNVSQPLG